MFPIWKGACEELHPFKLLTSQENIRIFPEVLERSPEKNKIAFPNMRDYQK